MFEDSFAEAGLYMIKIYKKKTLPKGIEVIRINDVYFNKYTSELLDVSIYTHS